MTHRWITTQWFRTTEYVFPSRANSALTLLWYVSVLCSYGWWFHTFSQRKNSVFKYIWVVIRTKSSLHSSVSRTVLYVRWFFFSLFSIFVKGGQRLCFSTTNSLTLLDEGGSVSPRIWPIRCLCLSNLSSFFFLLNNKARTSLTSGSRGEMLL